MNDISINWGVLAFALAVSVAAGIVFGLAPAWLMSRSDLIGTLRQEGRGSIGSLGRSRARQILVISELALSLVLMVAAGLLLRSFWDLFKVQPGFNPDRVMAIQTWLPGPNDPTDGYLPNRHPGIGPAARDSSPQPNPAGRRRSGRRRRGRSSPGPQPSQPAAVDPRRHRDDGQSGSGDRWSHRFA